MPADLWASRESETVRPYFSVVEKPNRPESTQQQRQAARLRNFGSGEKEKIYQPCLSNASRVYVTQTGKHRKMHRR